VDARWLWSKGVVAQELANEPDLAKYNACVNPNNTDVIARAAQLGVNSTQYVDMYWIDYISLRTRATQDAYEDANADVAAGLIPCPACRGCACPLKPVIYAHGWSRNVLMQKSGNLQGAVLTNQHWRFPASTTPNWSPTHTTPTFPWGSDPGYDAFNIWSYHSYQRTPPSLRDQVNLIVADSANPGGDTQYTPGGVLTPMPVAITELGPELAVTYGQQGDSSDTIYQAARAASQLVTMAQYGYVRPCLSTSLPSHLTAFCAAGGVHVQVFDAEGRLQHVRGDVPAEERHDLGGHVGRGHPFRGRRHQHGQGDGAHPALPLWQQAAALLRLLHRRRRGHEPLRGRP